MLFQLFINGIVSGSLYALIALGFYLIYRTTGIFHFAHGVIFVISAYLTYLFYETLRLPFLLSLSFVIFISALIGIVIETALYRPLRKQGASQLVFLVGSMGSFLFLQNLVILLGGTDTRIVTGEIGSKIKAVYSLFGATFTLIQCVTLMTAITAYLFVHFYMTSTKNGKAIRAVASDPNMAEIIGIDVPKIYIVVFGLGSSLAAIAGILTSLDTGMDPWMGTNAVLIATIAVIIGGLNIFWGAALGGLFIGLAQNIGIWQIPSKWQNAIAFGLLMLFIIFRPKGILGQPLRKKPSG